MTFDLVDEIKLSEKEWLENGLDIEDHPLMTKWQYKDCPKCLTPFSIIKTDYANNWRCKQCGKFFDIKRPKRRKVI